MKLNPRNTLPIKTRMTSLRASPCQTLTKQLLFLGFTDSTFCLL